MDQFNRQTLKSFYRVAKPFFVSDQKWKAYGLLSLLAIFALAVTGMNVLMSYIGRDFMTALSLREKGEFLRQLYFYLIAFAVATPLVVFYRYTEERLGLLWRRWLSRSILERYFSHSSYYKINSIAGIDNPDQRITEDIRSFTAQSLSFLIIIANSFIGVFSFMGILWNISPMLVFSVVGYAAFGSVSTYLLGKPLIGLNYEQLKKEADYRYKLINVRDNAESIAFYDGQRKESTKVRQRLKIALNNLLNIINWNRNLNFFTTGYNYLVSILPTVIVAPMYLDGRVEFGDITQASIAFGQVLGSLSIIVHNFGSLSSFAAVITRLGAFWETLDGIEHGRDDKGSKIDVRQAPYFSFQNVTIYTPKRDQILLKDMSVILEAGQSLLITGSSGSGKSSLLRVLAGLWNAGHGFMTAPPRTQSMFLPQRPYMVLGTLRSQLIYCAKHHGYSDTQLYKFLEIVDLTEMFHRIGGFDAQVDWPNILSTGEQQKLSFARLFIAEPKFAYLDEATTALDEKNECKLYELLRQNVKSYVSVGYSTSLAKFHHVTLELVGQGNWRLVCETDLPT